MSRNHGTPAVLAIFVLILISTSVLAEERPVQLSLVTPVQVFPEEDSITGIRLNVIYGRNSSVQGLDIGLVNHTTSAVSKGWQLGLVGIVETDFVGFQDNSVNIVKGDFKGLQWGIVNHAKTARGLQLGLVNYAESMYGLQIGIVNIISRGSEFPVLPIVNWSF